VGDERMQDLHTASSINLQVTPWHEIENRKKLSKDKLTELFEKSNKHCFARFDVVSQPLADVNK